MDTQVQNGIKSVMGRIMDINVSASQDRFQEAAEAAEELIHEANLLSARLLVLATP